MNMVDYWPNAIVQNYDGRVMHLYTSDSALNADTCFKQFDCWRDIYKDGHIVSEWIVEVTCGDNEHSHIVYHNCFVDSLGNIRSKASGDERKINRDPRTAEFIGKLIEIADDELKRRKTER